MARIGQSKLIHKLEDEPAYVIMDESTGNEITFATVEMQGLYTVIDQMLFPMDAREEGPF